MPAISGVRLATGEAGIKYKNRTDVLLALFEQGTTVAGVLTRSKCPSAPVEWCRARLKSGTARFLYLIPASPVARRTPDIAGMSGTCFGASGERG
jgi:N-acetylglutamate synthase/N-acetylornithine aminotransferase